MAQEGSPQGVVSLSSLQEAQGKVGRGVIRELRACRGTHTSLFTCQFCLPENLAPPCSLPKEGRRGDGVECG